MLLFGGHYNAAMIAAVPIIFNLDELRGDRSKIIDLRSVWQRILRSRRDSKYADK